MNKLSRTQLDVVAQHLQQASPHQALRAELLDHIASLIEQQLDQGLTFQAACEQVMQQANPQALYQLKQLYLQELASRACSVPLLASRAALRSRRHPVARSLQYILLAGVFTFLALTGCLALVSRPLAIPLATFQPVWAVGLAGLASVFLTRWWLARRLRKPKRLLAT